jgi:glycolate oxidase FAD binding subunit
MTPDGVPAELAAACTDVGPAGPADVIAGVPARYVAAPASTEEASALMRAAARLKLRVVPRGSGSRMHWGNPPAGCDLVVDTGRLDQVLEHAAGDLVVRVQAGVRLNKLAQVLASAGQLLALNPAGGGTIGGVVATQAAGSLRYRYGAPRDLLIGITVVRADGAVARSGGKVVKNVAGYDLGKLFAGSYGTLGLITEATFRLHPLPQRSSWLTLDCPDPEAAADAVQLIAESPVAPAAIDLDWPSPDAPLSVSVLIEGDEASVAARSDRMRALLERGLAGHSPANAKLDDGRELATDGTLIRVAFWVGQLARVLSTLQSAAAANGVAPAVRGSAGAGILEVWLAAESDAVAVIRFVAELRSALAALADGLVPGVASAVVVHAPAAVREAVDMWGPVPSLRLMQAVKDQFDPGHRMAPGRLAGGI